MDYTPTDDLGYGNILQKALFALYASMCYYENHSHPVYKEFINRSQSLANDYSNKHNDKIENLLLDSIQRSITAIFNRDKKNIFVPTEYFEILKDKHDLPFSPKFSWIPFLKTISGIKYSGKARLPRIIQTGRDNGLIVNWHNKIDFDSDLQHDVSNPFWRYFPCFDFSQYSFDQLIYILANNSLPTKKYDGIIYTAELCSATIQTQTYNTSLSDRYICRDYTHFNKIIENIIRHPNLLDLRSSQYFPIIAQFLKIDDATIRYFINSEPSVKERNYYENSYLNGYDDTDLTRGLEQVEDDETEDTDDPTNPETNLDESEDKIDSDDDSKDDESGDDVSDKDKPNEQGTDTDPEESGLPISEPQAIFIDLAGDQESLEDILYKTQVCEMVRGYKKNPPSKLKLEELLLLEIWCTRWIFLANAQTTKSLLSELSITVDE